MYLILLAVVVGLLYLLTTYKFNYWKKRNVPYLPPTPLFGNYAGFILMKEFVGETIEKIVKKFPNEPYIGAFFGTEPTLIVQDPELIKLITTKDFVYFNGREIDKYTGCETVTSNMFFTHGDRWKSLRQNFSPLFSSGKMKNMFPYVVACSKDLVKLIDYETEAFGVINTRVLISRFTIDNISSCAFGVHSGALQPNSDGNPFRAVGNQIFEISYKRGWDTNFRAIWPAIFYGLGFQLFKKEIRQFFSDVILKVFKDRNYEPTKRNDFIDLMLNLKKEKKLKGESLRKTDVSKVELEIDDNLLLGQCVMIFAAGFDTSASTMSFTLYELSKRPDFQKRAMQEVDEYLKARNGEVDYDCVAELPFLNSCLYETIRMYPVLGHVTREVSDNYTLPTGLKLEKGLRIHIPVYNMHRDPRYFQDPETYNPDRFYMDNGKNQTPYTFMPFGEGPRICLGMRFAKMQIMAGLVAIFRNYSMELSNQTPMKLKMEPRAAVTQAAEQLMIIYKRRTDAPYSTKY